MYYNKPVLYDNSVTLREHLSVHPIRSKHLIIYEQKERDNVNRLIHEITAADKPYEVYELKEELNLGEISQLLEKQKMGTQLYIACDWDKAAAIFSLAIDAGFTEDEIQTKIYGLKRKYVYCIKCYQLSEVGKEDTIVHCPHCSAKLEVGPFFSRVRKGYIGYVLPQ